MKANRTFRKDTSGEGFLVAVILLVSVLMATVIGAVIFFSFIEGVSSGNDPGNYTDADNTTNTVKSYAITVFGLLAIVPLIMVGGLMLRSLGFMGGAGAEF